MPPQSVIISTNFFKTLTSILHLSRFFGLMPLEWHQSDTSYTIKKSKVIATYSLSFGILIVIASICGLSQVYKVDIIYSIRLGTPIGSCVNYTDVTIVLLPILIATLATSFNLDRIIDYFDHLNQFDKLLNQKFYSLGKFRFVTVSTMTLATSLLVFDLVIWINLGSRDLPLYKITIYFLPYYFSYFFTVVIELIYWNLVHSVKIRISVLNVKLCQGDENDKIKELFARNDKKMINYIVDTLNNDFLKTQQIRRLATTQIRNFIKAYVHLTTAKNHVNECYGFIIMLVILGCFIHLLVTPYALRSLIKNTDNDEVFIVSQMLWMAAHILRLLLVVEPCHGCAASIKQTASIICRMLLNCGTVEEIKLLQFFLSCLSQNPIEFTAFGLTKIDRGMLTGIAGAVTTYLVILFQFN